MALTIIVDPGHGGDDPGAQTNQVGNVCTADPLQEKERNLVFGQQVCELLNRYRINDLPTDTKVISTRGSDSTLSLHDRVHLINNISNPKLVFSIHCNSFSNDKATGYELLIYGEKTRELAKEFMLGVYPFYVEHKDRGIKLRPDLYLLKRTNCPSFLFETEFLSNPAQAKFLTDQSTLIAKSICNGIVLSSNMFFSMLPSSQK